jgi:hypothetical protein
MIWSISSELKNMAGVQNHNLQDIYIFLKKGWSTESQPSGYTYKKKWLEYRITTSRI